MEKKYKKLYIEDLEKINGGIEIFDKGEDECPLYGEHQWKQVEGLTMESCDCGACRFQIRQL